MAVALPHVPEELVPLEVPLEQVRPVSHVRSTLLTSSLRALREHDLLDAYLGLLPAHYHEVVLTSIAGTWHDVEIAIAHYEACDRLGLTDAQQFEIGLDVGARIQGTFMGILVRMASSAGATPWMPLGQCSTYFKRIYQGGGIRLSQLGPKEAVLELVGLPLSRFGYFRHAQRGLIQAFCQLFCKKAHVFEQSSLNPAKRLGYRVSWV